MLDVATRKVLRKIKVGSDPEEFDLSADGKHLFVSNEDVKTASSVDLANGKVEKIVRAEPGARGRGGEPRTASACGSPAKPAATCS